MRKTVLRRLEWSFQESWITTIRQDEKSSRWKNSKIMQRIKPFHIMSKQSKKNYRNETQAIDSEKQFIENKVKIKFKL